MEGRGKGRGERIWKSASGENKERLGKGRNDEKVVIDDDVLRTLEIQKLTELRYDVDFKFSSGQTLFSLFFSFF